MVVKTITVTQEAYDKVKCLKRPEESFSELFIRISEGKSNAVEHFFGAANMTAKEIVAERERLKRTKKEMAESFERKQARLRKRLGELTE